MSSRHPVLRLLRNKFIAGLIILIPIVIASKVLWWMFTYVDSHARPLLRTLFGREIPGVGFAITVAMVLLTGVFFSAGPLRRLLDGLVEVLENVPVFGAVYGTVRKVLSGFGNSQAGQAFQRFVLVRRGGTLSPGFLTGSLSLARTDGTSETYWSVYIPTNHLYLGNIVVVPDTDVIPTDISVEDGISVVLTGGSAIPADVRERL